jgi:hypothetical protein
MEVCPTHACEPILGFKCSAILPQSTEPRRNLRHSERSERGGKVPEGLRLTGEGWNDSALNIGTSAIANEVSEEEKLRRGCG